MPDELRIEMEGEALFNDGVGVVLFTLLLGFATGMGGEAFSVPSALVDFVVEAAEASSSAHHRVCRLSRHAGNRQFEVETLITLSVVAGTYAVAQRLGVSAPLAVVAAGSSSAVSRPSTR